ncbi:hypothetical protein [Rhodococcus tukisamuensis]|nr:hypothetical protein [Rhodococcus tukisamuensis]
MRLLIANVLLDELWVWLHPIISGNATHDQLMLEFGSGMGQVSSTETQHGRRDAYVGLWSRSVSVSGVDCTECQ